MINAKGHYDETKNRALIEMTICLIGQAIFVHKFGIIGVLIGTILAYLYRTLDVIIYSNRKVLNKKTTKTFIRIVVNIILMCLIVMFVKVNFEIDSYLTWIIYSIITAILSFIIISIANIIFDKEAVKFGQEYILNIVRRNNKND